MLPYLEKRKIKYELMSLNEECFFSLFFLKKRKIFLIDKIHIYIEKYAYDLLLRMIGLHPDWQTIMSSREFWTCNPKILRLAHTATAKQKKEPPKKREPVPIYFFA